MRSRSSEVVSYRLFLTNGDRLRSFNEAESRRYEIAAIEEGEFPGSFTDVIGAWHIVGAVENGLVVPSRIGGKRLPISIDPEGLLLLNLFRKVRTARRKGGVQMARSISVNEILKQAQAAQDAYDEAVAQRKAVRKVARTLAEAGLLDDEDVEKVEEIFPARKRKEDDGEEDGEE